MDSGMSEDDIEIEGQGGSGDEPLIDLNDAEVKKLIARAKKRGYITYDELNAALPQDQMSSEQIEDIMSAISEMGVNIVEKDDDADEEDESAEKRRSIRSVFLLHPSPFLKRRKRPSTGPMIRCACICARWARSNC
jgi:RNA polymerase primary sigma factor